MTTLGHQHWINVILSTFFRRCFVNVETTSINIHRLNFHFQANFNAETTLMNVDGGCFNVDSTLMWFLGSCTLTILSWLGGSVGELIRMQWKVLWKGWVNSRIGLNKLDLKLLCISWKKPRQKCFCSIFSQRCSSDYSTYNFHEQQFQWFPPEFVYIMVG